MDGLTTMTKHGQAKMMRKRRMMMTMTRTKTMTKTKAAEVATGERGGACEDAAALGTDVTDVDDEPAIYI